MSLSSREVQKFFERAAGVDPNLFVWVDECGTHTSMTRLYARAPREERGPTAERPP